MNARALVPLVPLVVLAAASGLVGTLAGQGPLVPPGAPAPTMKKLDQIASTGIAINDTNTPGDVNSLYVISSPGTYYLTGNVTGVAPKRAILINSVNVTVDLNGFALVGVASTGTGISDGGVNRGQATIRNGSVVGWGIHGVNLSASRDVLIHDLIVTNNTQNGLLLGDTAHVRDCVLHDNSLTNLQTGFNANVARCSSIDSFNGSGFDLGQGSMISGCVANYNLLGSGIAVGIGSSVGQCTVFGNGIAGVLLQNNCIVKDCAASNNAVGIQAAARCNIVSNTASSNNGAGIKTTDQNNRIEGNLCNSNTGYGIQSSGPLADFILRNTCFANTGAVTGTSTSNYLPKSGTYFGPLSTPGSTSATAWSNF